MLELGVRIDTSNEALSLSMKQTKLKDGALRRLQARATCRERFLLVGHYCVLTLIFCVVLGSLVTLSVYSARSDVMYRATIQKDLFNVIIVPLLIVACLL